ncbi:hypothetical protein EDB86DRAFT_3072845 [Lactarius hatsudake]|nr:hypothetical protein EDB86DRAFT_3072845 [Lactarius hatsudake]
MPWRCAHPQALHSRFHDLFQLKWPVRSTALWNPLAHQAPGAHVLILGGGVAGVITARTLAQQGITGFIIVEARDELGGRMRSAAFGAPNRRLTIELGANWIQGTQEGNSPANSIFELALKHNLNAVEKNFLTGERAATYDVPVNEAVDYLERA